MPLIEANDLVVKLGKKTVLRNINFGISQREIVTIVGPNGAGKSTLLRCLIGAIPYHQGTLQIQSKLNIGYVPQRPQLEPSLPLTVLRFLNLPHKTTHRYALQALCHAGAEALIERQMMQLSGGQLQRVMLARALLNRPQVLILDEATQGLDHLGSISFYRQLGAIRANLNCAILMVSHELHVVMAASDRVICLNGHICCQGPPKHVASSPQYHALFGTDVPGAIAIYHHEHNHSHDEGIV